MSLSNHQARERTFSMRIGIRQAEALAMAALAIAIGARPSTATADALKGTAAFGDWKSDKPGVTRHLMPQDLPSAEVLPTMRHAPQIAPLPSGAKPEVPAGFQVELVAQNLGGPRVIRVAPNGDLFIADGSGGRILVYRMNAGTAAVQHSAIFAGGLNRPYGIAFFPATNPKWVYVANTSNIVRFPYKNGDMTATGEAEVIVSSLPANGNHWTRDIAFSVDQKTMFVSVGSATNFGERMPEAPSGGLEKWEKGKALGAAWGPETERANVLAFTPDGRNRRVHAAGLRNCAGMSIQPKTGGLWCAVNERDLLGDDAPFEYLTSVKPGAFYGWPWFYIGDHEDPRLTGKRADLRGRISMPEVLFQAHSAPLGVTFYTGTSFPGEYQGDAFVALHGSWNRAKRTGYKLVRVKFRGGKPTGEYEDFLTGMVVSDDAVWGRPVGVAVAKDGSLIMSEDGNGTLWRISWSGVATQ